MEQLRRGVLKDFSSMLRHCHISGGEISGGACCQNYGFVVETERYRYCLRCNPVRGDYQAYLSCFDKQAQKQAFGLTGKGRQTLRDAADPAKPHAYRWYVIEHISTPELRADHELPLEEAVRLYAELDCVDKRLGVTKDGIASVDLVISKDGREWISEDYQKGDSFAQDPVVAGAVSQIRQALEEQTQEQGFAMGGMG